MRRPPTGLLANQWEMPCVEVSSDCDDEALRETCLSYLDRICGIRIVHTSLSVESTCADEGRTAKRTKCSTLLSIHAEHICVHESPVVHIFSHEKHIMRIVEIEVNTSLSVALQDAVQLWGSYQSINDTPAKEVSPVHFK